MNHALESLRVREKYSTAILWTVVDYERGHAFYRATGWKPLGKSRAEGTEVAFGQSWRDCPDSILAPAWDVPILDGRGRAGQTGTVRLDRRLIPSVRTGGCP